MKNLIISMMVSFLSLTVEAQTLICSTNGAVDIDIKIETLNASQERLSVVLKGLDGKSSEAYTNSQFENADLTKALSQGKILAVVSLDETQESYGGIYENAGLVSLIRNSETGIFEVLFSAKGSVYPADCR